MYRYGITKEARRKIRFIKIKYYINEFLTYFLFYKFIKELGTYIQRMIKRKINDLF